MKAIKFLRGAIILIGILLSACASAANSSTVTNEGGKGLADISFTGVIESMTENQWVINGQTVQVDASVLRDGPFAVGDTVKVEASVSQDGSVTAQRVETPSAADIVEIATSAPDDSLSTPMPGSATQVPVVDDKGNEVVGTVDAITDTSITVGGQTYSFALGVEIKGDIVAGASVKLHVTVNSDGTTSVSEIELADPAQVGDDHGTDDSTTHDVNDDHGGTTTSSDDGANHDTNDDHGGNSNSGSGADDDSGGGNSGPGG